MLYHWATISNLFFFLFQDKVSLNCPVCNSPASVPWEAGSQVSSAHQLRQLSTRQQPTSLPTTHFHLLWQNAIYKTMLDRPAITNDVMGHLKLPPLHPGIFLLGKHGPTAEQTQVGTWGLTHFCICGIRTKQVHNGQLFSEDYSVENSQRKSFLLLYH